MTQTIWLEHRRSIWAIPYIHQWQMLHHLNRIRPCSHLTAMRCSSFHLYRNTMPAIVCKLHLPNTMCISVFQRHTKLSDGCAWGPRHGTSHQTSHCRHGHQNAQQPCTWTTSIHAPTHLCTRYIHSCTSVSIVRAALQSICGIVMKHTHDRASTAALQPSHSTLKSDDRAENCLRQPQEVSQKFMSMITYT